MINVEEQKLMFIIEQYEIAHKALQNVVLLHDTPECQELSRQAVQAIWQSGEVYRVRLEIIQNRAKR